MPAFTEPLIYCLSMKTNRERFSFMAEQLQNISVEFVESIVPAEYPDNYAAKKRLRHYGRPMSLGEVGCYLSHRKIWRLFLDTSHDYAVVLEDDMDVGENFLQAIQQISMLNTPADLIRLHGIYRRKTHKLEQFSVGDEVFWLCDVNKQPAGTGAYIIYRDAASRLLEYTKEMYSAIDDAIDRDWEHKLKMLTISPNIVKASRRFPSTISRIRPTISWNRKMIRVIFRIRPSILKAIHRFNKTIRWKNE